MDGFQRDISFKIDRNDGNDILVICRMTDWYHDIRLRVVVERESLRIREIGAAFRRSPSRICHQVEERLGLLVGSSIGKGLTRRLFDALGGSRGCGNLRNMLLCSLPVVLNVKAAEGVYDHAAALSSMHEKLHGTCVGYASPSGGEGASSGT